MGQDEQRYNGWTNYETWVTALWLDNDQATQEYWQEIACECRDAAPATYQVEEEIWTVDQAACYTLADRLKDEVTDTSISCFLLDSFLECEWPNSF
jgi:hypothetical protein